MPQSGWNWDSNVDLSHKWDATLKIITFNSPPKRIKSPMYSIYYRIKNESNVLFPYESLCFGDDFDDIVSDSEKLCKLPFSSCVMSWNEDYDNLKEKTYSYNGNEYYYFKLLASFELKITSLNFKDIETDTSANFGNFIKNCYIADQINN
jgi:hypothetical protein